MKLDDGVAYRLSDTRGLIEKPDGERLAELASLVDPAHAIVEIGTHTGLSSMWMAAGSQGAHVFCVDPWFNPGKEYGSDPFELGTGDAVMAEFFHNVSRFHVWDKVTALRGRSLDIAAVWTAPIGLLFIDAIHTFDGARSDYEAWQRFIVSDGWIAFDDWFADPERTRETGVARFIQDCVIPNEEWTELDLCYNVWSARRR